MFLCPLASPRTPYWEFHDCNDQLARPAKEDDACNSQSLETAKEDATTRSSVEDVEAEEIARNNEELSTPWIKAEEKETTLEKEAHCVENSSQFDFSEGNSPEITTVEVRHIPTDEGHEGASHISHDPSTEQIRTKVIAYLCRKFRKGLS